MPAPLLNLDQVAERLNTSKSQIYALVRSKQLRAVKIGGRGQWRVSEDDLTAYLEQAYRETADWIDRNPHYPGVEVGDEQP